MFLFPPVAGTLGPKSVVVRERVMTDGHMLGGAPVAVFVVFTFLFYSLNCAV